MFLKKVLLIAMLFVVVHGRAACTNEVDVVSLGRISTGISEDGWRVTSVTNYSDHYRRALRFNVKTSTVISPTFQEPVTRVVLQTISSTNAFRRLMFTPQKDGVALTNLVRYCAYSPTKNIFVRQTLEWPSSAKVNAFTITLEQGGSTAWGVSEMTVFADEPPKTGFYLRFR